MKGVPASFEARHLGGLAVVAVIGEVDYSNTAELEATLLDAAASGRAVVDLAAAGYLDSSGVRSLFWVANHGIRLHIVAPAGGLVRRTLQMAGLEKVATLHEDLDAATAGARS